MCVGARGALAPCRKFCSRPPAVSPFGQCARETEPVGCKHQHFSPMWELDTPELPASVAGMWRPALSQTPSPSLTNNFHPTIISASASGESNLSLEESQCHGVWGLELGDSLPAGHKDCLWWQGYGGPLAQVAVSSCPIVKFAPVLSQRCCWGREGVSGP